MSKVNTGACGLDNMLQSVLSVALQEQNNVYPAFIFQSQFNVVTSLLISELAEVYPDNSAVLDMLNPFVKVKVLDVVGGFITLPDDYRNLLGSPYIFARNAVKECEKIPQITNANEFQTATLKGACQAYALSMVKQSEFASLTQSKYKAPDFENPIGYFSGVDDKGNKQIKVCPFDLSKVALLYTRNEKKVVYTYIQQPDDTYIFDPDNPALQDSEWTSAAFKPIFNAMISLFSAYTRDDEMQDWAKVLKNGIL
jgi:hypothetical protein